MLGIELTVGRFGDISDDETAIVLLWLSICIIIQIKSNRRRKLVRQAARDSPPETYTSRNRHLKNKSPVLGFRTDDFRKRGQWLRYRYGKMF